MKLSKYLILAATLGLLTGLAHSASISCEGAKFSVKAEKEGWGFESIYCTIDSDELRPSYSGNLSEETDVVAIEEEEGRYLVAVIVDARELDEEESYKGQVDLFDDSGNKVAEFPVNIRIGEGKNQEISVSKDEVRFMFTKMNYEDCYTVEVENSGNADLEDLSARVKTHETGNVSWITISDISEDVFEAGDKKDLKICVNNHDNFTGWKERESTITIETDQVNEEIKVLMVGDWQLEIQKKYDQLLEQHQFLEKGYSQIRAYKDGYLSLNNSCTNLLLNYSSLNRSFTNLSEDFKEARLNYSLLLNQSLNDSNNSILESELEGARNRINELMGQITDNEAMIELLSSKPRKEENKSSALPIVGNAVGISGSGIYVIFPVIGAAFILGAYSGRRLLKRTGLKKKAAEAKKEPAVIQVDERAAQKEALRKALLEKLGEKKTST